MPSQKRDPTRDWIYPAVLQVGTFHLEGNVHIIGLAQNDCDALTLLVERENHRPGRELEQVLKTLRPTSAAVSLEFEEMRFTYPPGYL